MNPRLIRAFVILLLPCLIIDPALAGVAPASLPVRPAGPQGLFQCEAVVPALREITPTIFFNWGVRQRKMEAARVRSASAGDRGEADAGLMIALGLLGVGVASLGILVWHVWHATAPHVPLPRMRPALGPMAMILGAMISGKGGQAPEPSPIDEQIRSNNSRLAWFEANLEHLKPHNPMDPYLNMMLRELQEERAKIADLQARLSLQWNRFGGARLRRQILEHQRRLIDSIGAQIARRGYKFPGESSEDWTGNDDHSTRLKEGFSFSLAAGALAGLIGGSLRLPGEINLLLTHAAAFAVLIPQIRRGGTSPRLNAILRSAA
jgi:hypothetical protein